MAEEGDEMEIRRHMKLLSLKIFVNTKVEGRMNRKEWCHDFLKLDFLKLDFLKLDFLKLVFFQAGLFKTRLFKIGLCETGLVKTF